MKKKILISMICLLLTGCSVDYTLDFDNGDIREKIIYEFDEDIYKTAETMEGDSFYIEKELLEENILALKDYDSYYDKKIDIIGNKSIVTLNYVYTYKNLISSYLINKCFENVIILNEENTYSLSLSGSFACFSSEDIQLKISSKNKVLSNNADYYQDGYYIWNLKIEDAEHEIKFLISKKELSDGISSFKLDGIKIIVIVLLIIGLGAYLFVKNKISRDTF